MSKKNRYKNEPVVWESSRRKKSGRSHVAQPFDEVLARAIGRICRCNRSFILAGCVIAIFFGTWAYAWSRVRDRVLADSAFQFAVERVVLQPEPPAWIRTDIRGETLRDASLDQSTSLFAPRLAEEVATAFSMHPWVAEVRGVRKEYPGRIIVELSYRQPACMVEVEGGLLPVDRHGTVLPTDQFRAEEAVKFPRLSGVDTVPIGPVGTRWGDIRVAEGARIAAAFSEVWNKMRLHHIAPEAKDARTARYSYVLVTRSGTRVRIGSLDEAAERHGGTVEEKAAWLARHFEQRGTLEGTFGPQEIDLVALPN